MQSMNEQSPIDLMPEGEEVTRTFKIRGYTTVEGFEEIIEEYRKFYIGERKSGRTDIKGIFQEFRRTLQVDRKVWFNPYPKVLSDWHRKWEKALPMTMRKVTLKGDNPSKQDKALTPIKEIAYHDLEDGAKNLQQILIDDAKKLIEKSNDEYQLIDENGGMWDVADFHNIQIKRKNTALAIAKEVMAGVHKHELVNIKKNKEGRETAGFLMDLMKSATAGDLSDQDLELLEQGVNA